MHNIALIFRRELSSFLRTPSGYIIAACLLIVDGLLFNARAVGTEARFSSEVLQYFFIDAGGTTMIAAVMFSMRMLAEERAAGTQTLLFTSPVRELEIVLGKFLATLVFLSVITLATAYLPALIFINGKVSVGHIASGYLGMLLLGAATLSVGMFASSLVKNPFLAVLLCAVFATTLELSWYVGKITDPPFKEIVGYFSPYQKHFQPFRRGLLQLSDVVYYVTVAGMSLLASVRVLQSQRWQ